MKKYKKLIVLSSVLVVIIGLIALFITCDLNFGLFKSLSLNGIKVLKGDVEDLMVREATEETNNKSSKNKLQEAKNNFDVAKEKYESIDESTIQIVQEATKQEDYFIEYLWVVLGNYANENKLSIHIITPGSSFKVDTENDSATTSVGGNSNSNSSSNSSSKVNENLSSYTPINNGVKIVVEGRYANLADFVFDVENDKELSFKLDNIKMSYAGDNKVQAIFDVLNLSVAK